MKYVKYWILFVLFMFPGRSESFSVNTGEHDGFTRIVVPHYVDTNFVKREVNGKFIVEFNTNIPSLNLEKVYERISKKRIGNISYSSRDGILYIDIICKCEVMTTGQDGRFLVIDVYDKIFNRDIFTNAVINSKKGNDTPFKIPRRFRGQGRQDIVASWPKKVADYSSTFLEQSNVDAEDPILYKGYLENHTLRKHIARREFLENGILGDISKFIGRGLLEKTPYFTSSLSNSSNSVSRNIQYQDSNIFIGNVREKTASTDLAKLATEDRVDCPRSTFFDPQKWNTSTIGDSTLFELPSKLFDGDGNVVPETALRLIKKYIVNGLLEEAQALSSYTSNMSEEAKVLKYFVDAIMSDEAHTHNFAQYSVCEGYVTLWEVLSGKDKTADLLSFEQNSGADDLVKQFVGIPSKLQTIIASRLVKYLDRQGRKSHADFVRKYMEIQGFAINHGTDRLELEVHSYGFDDASFLKLRSVNSLVTHLDNQIASYSKVDSSLIDLGLSQIGELSGTALGSSLLESTLVSLILNGKYSLALQMAKRYKVSDIEIEAILSRSIDKIFEFEDSEGILEIGSLLLIEITEHDLEDLAIYSNLLIDIGFVELSKYLIEAQLTRSDDLKVVHSRILNAEGNYEEAIAVLGDIDSVSAVTEKARALYKLRRYEEAMNQYIEVGDSLNGARIYWLHGPFARHELDFSSAKYERSIYMKRKMSQLEGSVPNFDPNPIQYSLRALSESKEMRSIVKKMKSVYLLDEVDNSAS